MKRRPVCAKEDRTACKKAGSMGQRGSCPENLALGKAGVRADCAIKVNLVIIEAWKDREDWAQNSYLQRGGRARSFSSLIKYFHQRVLTACQGPGLPLEPVSVGTRQRRLHVGPGAGEPVEPQ